MSDRWLRRIYATIVLGLLVWPLPHFFLTRELASDPWKNMGLAMYGTYFDVLVRVGHRQGDGDWQPLEPTDEMAESITYFAERRRAIGRLHSPDPLAQELADRLGARGIRIAVMHQTLDGAKGIYYPLRRERFDYEVGDDGRVRGGPVDLPPLPRP